MVGCSPIGKVASLSSSNGSQQSGGSRSAFYNEDDPDQTLVQFKPVFAVRGAACLACHAQVSGNMITDFGYGSPFYMGGSMSGMPYPDDAIPYYNHVNGATDQYGSFRLANIDGKLTVPKAPVPTSMRTWSANTVIPIQSFLGASSLADYMRAVVSQPSPAVDGYPAKTNIAVVEEKNTVFIGSLTPAEILSAGIMNGVKFKYFPQGAALPVYALAGLSTRNDGSGEYVSNTSAIACEGDVFIEGVLFLNHAQIQTTKGCRVHASESIFVQGALTLLGTAADRNIQLVSGKAIIMGMNSSTLRERLRTPYTTAPNLYRYPVRQAANNSAIDAMQMAIVSQADRISGLVDAGATIGAATAQTYERIFLSAPQVHSRYTGLFKGTVITEVAIFRLGNLTYSFDPVFERVPIVPMIGSQRLIKVE